MILKEGFGSPSILKGEFMGKKFTRRIAAALMTMLLAVTTLTGCSGVSEELSESLQSAVSSAVSDLGESAQSAASSVAEEITESLSGEETETSVEITEDVGGVSGDYDTLEVHFIDIGQGDCTLLKCGGQTMVIDCGDTDKGTAVQNYLTKQGVDTIDYLVLTHPDADHIGGAPVVITKFDIGSIYMSNYTKDTKTYTNVTDAISYRSYSWSTPAVGDTVTLGTAVITFLAPSKEYDDPNDASIALTVRNGNTSFMFSGDAEETAEKNIIGTGLDLDVDVYQVGHHGSSTSSSVDFLNAMTPTYAVISCEEGNSYGHPHAETLNNLRSMGVQVFRTDEQGSIIATSDGNTITWNCSPSETWQTGEKTVSSTDTTYTTSFNEPAVVTTEVTDGVTYILNTNSIKYHLPTCSAVADMSAGNRQDTTMTKDEVEAQGYVACKMCNP